MIVYGLILWDNKMRRYENNKTEVTKRFNGRRKVAYKTTIFPKFERHETDIYIQAREGDRLDNLAYVYYRDVKLWWVIAQANHIGKGSMHVKPAQLLRIPHLDRVFEKLNELKDIQDTRL